MAEWTIALLCKRSARKGYVGSNPTLGTMYTTYILENYRGKHYIGSTDNLEKRLEYHNSGKSEWTKKHRPWKVVYTEEFSTRSEAAKREREIKIYKGGNSFKKLISAADKSHP